MAFFFAKLPSTHVKWPVQMMSGMEAPPGKAKVYVRSDNAMYCTSFKFTVKVEQLKKFPDTGEKQKGLAALKKKPGTLKAFQEDLIWASDIEDPDFKIQEEDVSDSASEIIEILDHGIVEDSCSEDECTMDFTIVEHLREEVPVRQETWSPMEVPKAGSSIDIDEESDIHSEKRKGYPHSRNLESEKKCFCAKNTEIYVK